MRSDVWRRAAVSLVLGSLVVAACSSDESSGEVSVPVVSDVTTTSTLATTTSTTTTTTSTSTTTTTSTVPETTTTEVPPVVDTGPVDVFDGIDIPVNTMFDPATTEGEIEKVVLADNEAYKNCLDAMPNCDVDAATRFGRFEYASGFQDFLTRYKTEGRVIENAESIVSQVEGIRFGVFGDEAEVVICWEDDTRHVIPGTDETADRIVAEGFQSVRQQILLQLQPDGWRIVGATVLGDSGNRDASLCR